MAKKTKYLQILLIFMILFGLHCSKEYQGQVPYVPVNITITTSDPEFFDLNAVGGWTYITGGSRGIIVYRYSQDEFRAYDRHCPYDPASSCALVSVDANNIEASDPCCQSAFILSTGQPVRGPSSFPLKSYQTSFDGTVLRITN
ncbi:MAG: hypothetical protein KatS3mg034_1244 [Vicingaceae bacterium]|nr:MAG: hypothetical protein KatS3mg034_1244 [Vicingaceae bacterium]